MKKLFYLMILIPSLALGQSGVSQPPIWNPHTGNLDFIGPGNGLLAGDTYYFYKNPSYDAYYTFDGTNLCLFVNDVSKVCYAQAPASNLILLEDGTFMLLEDGTKVKAEH